MTLFKRTILTSAALAAALWLEPVSAQELETGPSAQTSHEGVFDGVTVAYDAFVETYLLPGAACVQRPEDVGLHGSIPREPMRAAATACR